MAQIELIYQAHRLAGSPRAKIPKMWTNEMRRRMMTELLCWEGGDKQEVHRAQKKFQNRRKAESPMGVIVGSVIITAVELWTCAGGDDAAVAAFVAIRTGAVAVVEVLHREQSNVEAEYRLGRVIRVRIITTMIAVAKSCVARGRKIKSENTKDNK